MAKHILSVLVENHAGVLLRVAGLFGRRGFNIDSLVVGVTESPAFSRMTIVVECDDKLIEQVMKQLNKLIDVIKVRALSEGNSVNRELALIKVSAPQETRHEIIQMVNIFRAKVVDVAKDSLTIEVTGTPEKIIALCDMLAQYGILEMARTGMVSLERGSNCI